MKIQFDGLWDVKEFMLMVDIYQWCDKEKAWGGKGYRIQNWYIDDDTKEKTAIEESDQSKVIIPDNGDYVIITPYYKQLSWLFGVLHEFGKEGYLHTGVFLNGFHTCCDEYFKKNPDHSAKELMLYILENMQQMNDEKTMGV